MPETADRLIDFDAYWTYNRCPRLAWFHEQERISQDEDPELEESIASVHQFFLDAGMEGVLIESEGEAGDRETILRVAEHQSVLFQAQAIHDRFIATAEGLVFNEETRKWDMFMVTEGTKKNSKHTRKAEFNRFVFEQTGYQIGKIHLVKVNSEYTSENEEPFYVLQEKKKRGGGNEIEDITPGEKIRNEVRQKLAQINIDLNSATNPWVEILKQCQIPEPCEHIGECHEGMPDYPVHELRGMKEAELRNLLQFIKLQEVIDRVRFSSLCSSSPYFERHLPVLQNVADGTPIPEDILIFMMRKGAFDLANPVSLIELLRSTKIKAFLDQYALQDLTRLELCCLPDEAIPGREKTEEDLNIWERRQRDQIEVAKSGEARMNVDKIAEKLSGLGYPRYYLDYETIQLKDPLPGYKPYQQLVFQFSLHIQRGPRETLEHHECIVTGADGNPVEKITKELMALIKDDGGPVIVWNKSFEGSRNTEMGKMPPFQKKFFEGLNNRMFDLMEIFDGEPDPNPKPKKGEKQPENVIPFDPERLYVDPHFRGRWSIKKILEVFRTEENLELLKSILPPNHIKNDDELDYTKLDCPDGLEAMTLGEKLFDPEVPLEEKDAIKKKLFTYCKLDTLSEIINVIGLEQEILRRRGNLHGIQPTVLAA